MHINGYLGWILVYVAVIIAISGIFVRKSIVSYAEYTVGSKSIGFVFIFFTYFSTWISGATILGMASISFKWGLYQYWFMAVTYIVGAFSGPLFLMRIRAINVYTVGDFFALRYPENEKLVRNFVALSQLCRNISIVGSQLTTIAFIVSITLNVDFSKILFLTAIFIITYTAMSGIWGVVSTDVIQGLLQMIGLPVLVFYVFKATGGFTDIISFYEKIGGSYYLNIFAGGDKLSEVALMLLAPGLFFIVEDQTTWQRILSSKNDRVAFWGYLAPLGAVLLWTLIPCILGVFSKVIFPSFTAYPVALLEFVFSLPRPAIIMIMCAILSAAVSTSDSYLLASGIIISRDIVQKIFQFKGYERQLIGYTIMGIVVSGMLSLWASSKIYDIFDLYMMGAYIGGSALTIPYLLTWFSKRMNGVGIVAGISCGILSFILCAYSFHLTFSISMLLGMATNFIAAQISCRAAPVPKPEAVEKTFYFSQNFANIKNIPK